MADDSGHRLELADGVNVVIRDLLDALVGKDLRIFLGLLNGVRVIGPARCDRRVALLFEQLAPVVPTAGEEPQAVDEHDRLLTLRVGVVDFLLFMVCENCHLVLLWVCLGVSVGSIGEIVPFNISRSSRLAYVRRNENPSRSQAVARAIAPRAAAVCARAFNMTKSWMVPWNRTAVTRTPASRSLLA